MKQLYPGVEEAERERIRSSVVVDEEPDFIGGCVPNYAKFEKYGWSVDRILAWLNID